MRHLLLIVCLAGCTRSADLGAGSDASPAGLDASIGPGADLAGSPFGPYDSDGGAAVQVVQLQVQKGVLQTFTVDVYLPSTTGPRPVVILASGFFQKADAYAPYARRLASHGVLTILRDDPNVTQPSSGVADDISYLVNTWLGQSNSAGQLAGRIDVAKIGLAGHSRGGQAALLAATGGAKGKVKAFFGIDPVDSKPMFSVGNPVLARTDLPSIAIPTVFLGELTDKGGSGTPCAPEADNYAVLYGVAPSPSLAITAINADHTDFQDQQSCFQCNQCTQGTANPADVLAYSVRYLTAFFARELLADPSVGPTLAGAGSALDVAATRIELTSK